MKKAIILFLLSAFLMISGCNQLSLNNIEAEGLIKNILELPKSYREDIGLGFGASTWLDALQNDGLITYHIEYSGPWNTYLYLNPTENGNSFYLGVDPQNSNIHRFKTNDIDFDQIIGISVSKESQTATIRFSLKATNITPVASSLKRVGRIKYPLDLPISAELVFKKFDSGWQLLSDQNKSSNELVNQFLNGNN